MSVEPRLQVIGRANLDQHDAENGSSCKQDPAEASQQCPVTEQSNQGENQQDGKSDSYGNVKQHHDAEENCRGRISVQIRCTDDQRDQASQ